jgi:hypothetical protein
MIHSQYAPAATAKAKAKGSLSAGTVQPSDPVQHLPPATSATPGSPGGNSGVPATEVAAWAGHSVEMLMRVCARCAAGLEGVWIGRMAQALHLGEGQ